jgi:hypothetical protein
MLVMPPRSDRKKSDWPSDVHCGLMFLAPSNPPALRTVPETTSITASCSAPASSVCRLVENRSVLNAIVRPSGDHAGSSSVNASVVSRRTLPLSRS